MCFILTAIKLKENAEAKRAIFEVLRSEQASNSNGTGSVCFDLDNSEPRIQRAMTLSREDMRADLEAFDLVSYHLRTATSGEKDERNVHFWKNGQWAFCHNGTITDKAKDGFCDSRVFFDELVKHKFLRKNGVVDTEKIQEFTNQHSFWGRFMIFNLKSKKIYFFGEFQFYVLNRSYLVITSTTATFDSVLKVMGIDFELEKEIEVLEKEIDGVYILDPKKGKFEQKEWSFYKKEYKSCYNYNDDYPAKATESRADIDTTNTTKEASKPFDYSNYFTFIFNADGTPKTAEQIEQQVATEIETGIFDENGNTPTEAEQIQYEECLEYDASCKIQNKKETTDDYNGWKQLFGNGNDRPLPLPI